MNEELVTSQSKKLDMKNPMCSKKMTLRFKMFIVTPVIQVQPYKIL